MSSYREQALECYSLCNQARHPDAMKLAIEFGYADDEADFDAKVSLIEEEETE